LTFVVRLRGGSCANEDGSQRQNLLAECKPGDALTLRAEPPSPRIRMTAMRLLFLTPEGGSSGTSRLMHATHRQFSVAKALLRQLCERSVARGGGTASSALKDTTGY
jgi:hypothetical protein